MNVSEQEFRRFLDSGRLMTKEGEILPLELKEDTSPDPEDDRGEEIIPVEMSA